MLKAVVLKLYPSADQSRWLAERAGASRWVYNRVVALHRQLWERRKAGYATKIYGEYTWFKLIPYWRRMRPWLNEVPVDVLRAAIQDACHAYKKVYKKSGHRPHFRRKGEDETWAMQTHPRTIGNRMVVSRQLFTVRGPIGKLQHGKLKTARFKQECGQWFAYVCIDDGKPEPKPVEATRCLGIDLGLKAHVVTSTGKQYTSPQATRKYESRLAKLQRHFGRKQRGSKRRAVLKLKIARLHRKIKNTRGFHNKLLAFRLVNGLGENQALAVENLSVNNMVSNKRLSKSITDAGWSNLRKELEWQCRKRGRHYIEVNPANTSKRCSACGQLADLTLADRRWTCLCGASHQRDVNAAINISVLGLSKLPRMEKASTGMEGSKTETAGAVAASLAKCPVPAARDTALAG